MTDTTKTPVSLPLQQLVELVNERDTVRDELAQSFADQSDAEHKAALLEQQDEQHRAEIRALTDRAEAAEQARADAHHAGLQVAQQAKARMAVMELRKTSSFGERTFEAAPADPNDTPLRRLEQVIANGVGAGSTAWEYAPTGMFDDAYARSIVEGILAAVEVYADGTGPHVEIGGERMTEAQFNAARFPLLTGRVQAVDAAEPEPPVDAANEILQRLAGVTLTIEQENAIIDLARSRSTGVHDAVDPEATPERAFKVGDRVARVEAVEIGFGFEGQRGTVVYDSAGDNQRYRVAFDGATEFDPELGEPCYESELRKVEWEPGEGIEVGVEVEYVGTAVAHMGARGVVEKVIKGLAPDSGTVVKATNPKLAGAYVRNLRRIS